MAKKKIENFNEVFSSTDAIKIGEKTYITGKITIFDIIRFQNWCDKEAKKEVIELYKLAEKEVNMKELKAMTADKDYYDKKSSSIEGVIYLFTSIVKRLNKDVDENYITNNVTIDDIDRISDIISDDIEQPKGEDGKNFPEKKKKIKEKK